MEITSPKNIEEIKDKNKRKKRHVFILFHSAKGRPKGGQAFKGSGKK